MLTLEYVDYLTGQNEVRIHRRGKAHLNTTSCLTITTQPYPGDMCHSVFALWALLMFPEE